jgi:two-component system KDP operon response regulator KdpE
MTDTAPLRILVVEDEPVNRALLRAVLGSSLRVALGPTELTEAEDLATARRLVRERLPDVVILDVRLPDGNGLDLAAELPPPGAPGRPKVVIMSASVLPSDRRAAEESGSDAFMGKPFIPRELIAVLERLVGTGASEPAGG